MVYLDHHASQPMLPVVQELLKDLLNSRGNPSSVHRYGQQMRNGIEDVREYLAQWLGMADGRVVFTSGATEANNLVLAGHEGTILASATEHPAVLARVDMENRLAVDGNGLLDLAGLRLRLQQLMPTDSPLVSVMYAQNETGVIQPIAAIAQIVHQHGGVLHVDAVQGLGRAELDMRVLGIDILTLAGHKIGAPPALGAVIAPQTLPLTAQIIGGGQERGLRAGTENWLGILGLGVALHWFADHQAEHMQHLSTLDAYLAAGLAETAVQIVARDVVRIAGCSLLTVDGMEAQDILMQLDLAGIAVSSGSACSSGTVADSHVLRAMGLALSQRKSAIRVSFGHESTQSEVDLFLKAYLDIVR